MIFLSKKKILIILLFICLSFGILFTNANIKNETIETVSLPVSNKVIILDAGHRISR